ncbi:MAG TPA: FAD-binding domain [Gemmatimonadaceae bacterium]|nr:FAD-binding domain [Gemmatimonadaceae bacterium]
MTRGRVLISGAGIAGPALAYWLLRLGYEVTIVERAPALRTGGYMIDFWGVGYEVALRMGLGPRLDRDGYRIEELRIVNARGKRVSGFDASVFRAAAKQGQFTSILRGDLAAMIYDLVAGQVETMFGDWITRIESRSDGVDVSFAQGSTRRFDFVVGADGLHSNVRHLAFGMRPADEVYLGYYVAAFTSEDYPRRAEGVYLSFARPGMQIARYALRGGRTAFFLIFAQEQPLAIAPHDVAAQRAVIRERFAGAGWESDAMLVEMDRTPDLYFDAVAQTRLDRWSSDRVVLLGDAAYCPSLLAGQGSAFAMAGAYVLAACLQAAGGDLPRAFEAYERQFKPFIDAKQKAAVSFASWFAPRTPFSLWLRNVATSVLGLPVISRVAAKRMFGDRFELPELPVADRV